MQRTVGETRRDAAIEYTLPKIMDALVQIAENQKGTLGLTETYGKAIKYLLEDSQKKDALINDLTKRIDDLTKE